MSKRGEPLLSSQYRTLPRRNPAGNASMPSDVKRAAVKNGELRNKKHDDKEIPKDEVELNKSERSEGRCGKQGSGATD